MGGIMKNKFKIVGPVIALAVVIMAGEIKAEITSADPVVTTMAGEVMSNGSADGTGTAARFNFSTGVTNDGTALYVADTYNHTIRKVDIVTLEVTTLAGTAGVLGFSDGVGTSALFNYPQAITSDGTSLYVADTVNNTVRKILIATGEVTTLAGMSGACGATDGTGSDARFNAPHGITTDGTNLYVADTWNGAIRKIDIETATVTTLVNAEALTGVVGGDIEGARFSYITGITTDGTNLYFVDSGRNVIGKIVFSSGEVTRLAGLVGVSGWVDGAGSAALFNNPQGITIEGSKIYVADNLNFTIRVIELSTGMVSTLAGAAGVPGFVDGVESQFFGPGGVTTVGAALYVTDMGLIRKIR